MVECADVREHRRNMTDQQQRDCAGWLHLIGELEDDNNANSVSVVACNATDLNLDLDTLETMNGTTDLV